MVGRRAFFSAITTLPLRQNTLNFHNVWLRDHCQCEQCLHPATKQRLLDTFTIPPSIKPSKVETLASTVKITWENDGHESTFSIEWLQKHAYFPGESSAAAQKNSSVFSNLTLWDAETLRKNPPTVKYEDVMGSEAGLKAWIQNIVKFGIGFVEGVPSTVEATENLAKRISFIRVTHFGGFWDFQPNLEHADTAYTTIALGAHTDNTYFTDPSGLQMFHILERKGTGGESLFVDGFKVAEELRRRDPKSFEVLSTTPIPTHYLDEKEGMKLRPLVYQPMIVVSKGEQEGHPKDSLVQIRFNNDDRAPLTNLLAEKVPEFYKALHSFNQILRSKEMEYRQQLTKGVVVVFDNFRVLHGRSAFTGHRRMVGCYLNHDDFRSKAEVLLGGSQ